MYHAPAGTKDCLDKSLKPKENSPICKRFSDGNILKSILNSLCSKKEVCVVLFTKIVLWNVHAMVNDGRHSFANTFNTEKDYALISPMNHRTKIGLLKMHGVMNAIRY